MSGDDLDYVSLSAVASRADVRLSAVSNWRARHKDFPKPRLVAGQEVFDVDEVERWLRGRKIPKHRLRPDESLGTTYGDRFQRAVGPAAPTGTPAGDQPDTSWQGRLWAAADRLRSAHGGTETLEILLGLLYVRACRGEVWQSLVASEDWPDIHDVLSGVMLPLREGGAELPVARWVPNIVDPSLIEAIGEIDRIDLGQEVGSRSTAARIGADLLDQLERGMGKSGGHFTPPDIAQCLVELLEPLPSDRVYDPFCGSGELLCAAADYVSRGDSSADKWRVWGQAPHEWSWVTSTMNLQLHDVTADLGKPGLALQEDQFADRQFSLILSNPAFNLHVDLPDGREWPFGLPPNNNANFAWLQHVVTKLEPAGRAAVVMPAGAGFTTNRSEMAIRQAMVDAGVVECVIALPPGLFRFTGVSTLVWILRGLDPDRLASDTMFFIDARELGEITSGNRRRLSTDSIAKIAKEYRRWAGHHAGRKFDGVDGFSRAVPHREIAERDYRLEPGKYLVSVPGQVDAADAAARLDVLRQRLDDLSRQVDRAHVLLSSRLAELPGQHRFAAQGQSVPLGSVCDVLAGPGSVSREGHDPSWRPLVLPRNIRNNRIDDERLDVVPPGTARTLARYELAAGDIVTARAGTLGRFGLVTAEQAGWLLGPGCVRFRPNLQVIPEYLTYHLSSPTAVAWLLEHATGSVIQQLNRATLSAMPIWLPSLSIQQEILDVLAPCDVAASTYGQLSTTTTALRDLLLASLIPPSVTWQ